VPYYSKILRKSPVKHCQSDTGKWTPAPPALPHACLRVTPSASASGPLALPKAAPSRGREHFETLGVHTRDTWSPRPRRPVAHRRAQRSVGVRLPGRADRGSAAVRAGLTGQGLLTSRPGPPLACSLEYKTPVSLLVCASAPSPPLPRRPPTPFLTHSLGSAADPPPPLLLQKLPEPPHSFARPQPRRSRGYSGSPRSPPPCDPAVATTAPTKCRNRALVSFSSPQPLSPVVPAPDRRNLSRRRRPPCLKGHIASFRKVPGSFS
jgi:hypothetical protein